MKKYKQLRYCLTTASLDCGIDTHPQLQMKKLGYNVIDCLPKTSSDCWWFTVEDFIEPLPPYLSKMNYNYDYWHGACYRDCEYFKNNSSCCFGGNVCKKDI